MASYMPIVSIYKVLLCIVTFHSIFAKKNVLKSSTDLLKRELEKLKNPQTVCGLNAITLNDLNHLRTVKQIKKASACHLLYLQDHPSDGWAWSSLGQVYLDDGTTKANTQASVCFKQAASTDGSVHRDIKQWHFIGPFVIGKSEVDGDPLGAYGGIRNASSLRFKKKQKFHSELSKDGVVKWETHASRGADYMQISPRIDWNDLVNSLGSVGITEWQGWVVGDFAVNANNVNLIVQCMGVHTVFINGVPLSADLYRREQYTASTSVSKGIHPIYIRLRAKASQIFKCSIDVSAEHFEVHPPHYNPQLVEGYLFSNLLFIPITNYQSSRWLKITKVSNDNQMPIKTALLNDKTFSIAPGQTRPVLVEMTAENNNKVSPACEAINLNLKIQTSEGSSNLPITLTCRKRGESFVFTFLDHDGSVQHAAAIEPLSPCPHDICPVLLTLHGTTVPAQNQADSYKRGRGTGFVFGLENAWVLAPTRHGAHNWEGPGALTALTALERLEELTKQHDWFTNKATSKVAVFAGHSMGGHGAWHLSTHYPDTALALISLAGWIKKEEYGDSNLFFRHDIATSHVDPAVKSVLEACVVENEADRHVSNLKGISVLTRVGSNDRTIHPYFVRRMVRLLKEWGVDVSYDELPGKEHWWWDTKDTNDGGCVNDPALRDFTNKHAVLPPSLMTAAQCSPDNEGCHDNTDSENKYSSAVNKAENLTYTVYNPAFGGTLRGLQILQQLVPYRKSTIEMTFGGELNVLQTTNVKRFIIKQHHLRKVQWSAKPLKVDGTVLSPETIADALDGQKCLCREKALWEVCEGCHSLYLSHERGPHDLGPARRIAESSFIIVTGTQGTEHATRLLEELSVYVANQFFLMSDTIAPIIKDTELDQNIADMYNLIIIGGPEENSLTSSYMDKIPISIQKDKGVTLGGCTFSPSDLGVLFLAPHSAGRLALVVTGTSQKGLLDVISLASPTIPPMARSPFSNMVADFVITGPEFRAKGHGGYLCTGFWGNTWELRPDLISCAHCAIVH